MDRFFGGWLIGLFAVLAWPIVAGIQVWSRTRLRELQIRERIAMIEKGLVPPPEIDPAGFDRAMLRDRPYPYSGARHRRAGVTLIGIGCGLMFLLYLVEGDSRSALGVGGFLVILGIAFLINSFLDGPPSSPAVSPRPPSAS